MKNKDLISSLQQDVQTAPEPTVIIYHKLFIILYLQKEKEEINWSDASDEEEEREDINEIEAKNESVVEVKKDTKKKESLRDIFRDKRGKKQVKSRFEKKESNNNNNYYSKNDQFSGNENKYYNSNNKVINNDRQLYPPGSNSSKDNYYNKNPKYIREFHPNNKYQYNNNNTYIKIIIITNITLRKDRTKILTMMPNQKIKTRTREDITIIIIIQKIIDNLIKILNINQKNFMEK